MPRIAIPHPAIVAAMISGSPRAAVVTGADILLDAYNTHELPARGIAVNLAAGTLIPAQGGLYLVTALIAWDPTLVSSGTLCWPAPYLNGVSLPSAQPIRMNASETTMGVQGWRTVELVELLILAAGDVLDLRYSMLCVGGALVQPKFGMARIA